MMRIFWLVKNKIHKRKPQQDWQCQNEQNGNDRDRHDKRHAISQNSNDFCFHMHSPVLSKRQLLAGQISKASRYDGQEFF